MTACVDNDTMVAWCDKAMLVRFGIAENWIRAFVYRHPGDTRKLGDAKQCKRLYRISAVNAAIESGEVAR